MRAAIYARYSSDLQNDRSVEDQIRLCREHAARIGATVVGEFYDRAKSGASMFGRPGLADLMLAAERSEFEILLSESPDRISRDIADLAHVHKTLKFREITIHCVNGGQIDTVQVGMFGVIGQMQREEGAKKTKRGMVGVIRSGRSAGGKAYGYRPITGKPGELEIVEAEAEAVRRIFTMYEAGVSPRTIARSLNEDGIEAPRGKQWNASTLNGSGQRGNGLLRNPVYVGKLIWNRVRMVKDPSTGRRISRVNDASEYETIDAPHLRIVSDELFAAVQARKEDRTKLGPKGPRSKRILSGLLRCGACGGGMAIVGFDRSGKRIQCSKHRESGACVNSRRYYLERIEALVLSRLQSQFADTSIIEAYVSAYQEEQKRIRSTALRDRASASRLLEEAVSEINRIARLCANGFISEEELPGMLAPLRAQRDRQKEILESVDEPPNVIELQPKAVRRFRENIESLAQIVSEKGGEPSPELVAPFRQLVAAVIIESTPVGEAYNVRLKGYLSSLINSDLSVIKVVAGGGIEPPTSGL